MVGWIKRKQFLQFTKKKKLFENRICLAMGWADLKKKTVLVKTWHRESDTNVYQIIGEVVGRVGQEPDNSPRGIRQSFAHLPPPMHLRACQLLVLFAPQPMQPTENPDPVLLWQCTHSLSIIPRASKRAIEIIYFLLDKFPNGEQRHARSAFLLSWAQNGLNIYYCS